MSDETMLQRISNVGAGVMPTYHATESVEEAKAVVEQCESATGKRPKCLDLMDAIGEIKWWIGVNMLWFDYETEDLAELFYLADLLCACTSFTGKYRSEEGE